MRKKAYLILLLVALLVMGIGAASPAVNAAAQSSLRQTSECEQASTFLVGRLAEMPEVSELVQDLCAYRIRTDNIDASISRFDRLFVENAIASNMLELQTLEYTLARTQNEEYRGLIQLMIAMHTSDLATAIEVAEEIGADTTPDLTNARVYPMTPEYDLGIRRMNLVARFLDPLMSSPATETPTAIPTDMTMVPTETGTLLPMTPTAIGTVSPVFTPTGSATPFDGETETAVPTGTGTVVTPEETVTASPVTPTAGGTETETALPTVTETAGTPVATDTAVPTEPTETSTVVPTVTAPTTRPDFDLLSMHILEDEHQMSIEAALSAQRIAENGEIQSFAKHTADVAKLHTLLLDDLKYRLAHNYTLPEPPFQEDYQSPRRLEAPDEGN